MSKEMLAVVTALSNEKNVDAEVIFEAMEAALAAAIKKDFPEEAEIKVHIDRHSGEHRAVRCFAVPEEGAALENPETQLSLDEAIQYDAHAKPGSVIEKPESFEFGRISAQIAKQVIVQKVREAERRQIAMHYMRQVGELITGTVKKITRDFVILDLGNNAEGFIAREHMLPREVVRPSDRLRAYLMEVSPDARGQQIVLSRTAPEMLKALFKIEVPEIGEGIIDIRACARDVGSRAKIAVKTNDGRIDPIGACVGMRGARVQAVSNELGGERVDIVLWDDNPAQFVINAMAPAEVVSIVVDEETRTMDIAVIEEQLSQAIGRNGQNVKLASELTGWRLNVMSESEASAKNEAERARLVTLFQEQLDVDADIAETLVDEGFSTIEEVAFVPINEMLAIEGFDEGLVNELRNRSKDVLLKKAITTEERLENSPSASELMTLEGMTPKILNELLEHNIQTLEALAELSVDDLLEINGIHENQAKEWIMQARAPWFENE